MMVMRKSKYMINDRYYGVNVKFGVGYDEDYNI